MKTKYIDVENSFSQDKPVKYKRKVKRKHKKRFKFFKFLILTFLGAVTLVLLALSPLFYIDRIEVYGNNHYNDNEISGVCNLLPGNNWFKMNDFDIKSILLFRSVQAETNIKDNYPYVKSVIVRLGFPNVINITVTEREPAVIIPHKGTKLLVDGEGYILDAKENVDECSLPVMEGLSIDSYVLGQTVGSDNLKKLEAFKKVADEIESIDNDKIYDESKEIFKHVNYIDVSDLDNVCISLDSRIRVNLGSYKDIGNYRLSFLREVFFFKLKKEDKGYLDFTTGDRPSFIPE